MTFDFRAFLANHGPLLDATESLSHAILVAAEDAAKAAVSSIPVVGGIAETVASPALDGIESMVESKIDAALKRFFSPVPAPVVPAAPATAPTFTSQPGGDPRMQQKQADAFARAEATTDNGQRKPTVDFGQGDAQTGAATIGGTSNP